MGVAEPFDYCRQIEAYLCRKNDGHLIRVVGPAFEQVAGWASRGVPLKVAFAGIDRYFQRYYAKGERRRPVRIEFCEADVLDAFDEWRRSVGLRVSAQGVSADDPEPTTEGAPRRRPSLGVHLDRVIARLTVLRGGGKSPLEDAIDSQVRELDAMRAGARNLRGEARQGAVDRLRRMDEELVAAAFRCCEASLLSRLEADADAELAPFKPRMSPDTYEQARRAALARLVRERMQLPVVAVE